MIGQLPPEFFTRFFSILNFSPQEAEEYQQTINQLCRRAFVYQQLQVLPERERLSYTRLLEQDNISPDTISEFIEPQIDDATEQALWQQALIHVWQEILDTLGQATTKSQKDQVRALLREYSQET